MTLQVGERPPISEEQRAVVASWIQDNLRPVGHVIAEDQDATVREPAPEFEVREYQVDALAHTWNARAGGIDRGLIHLATGLGKTSVAVADFIKFCEERRLAGLPPPKGLFASHQLGINDQAARRFSQYIEDLSVDGEEETATGPRMDFKTLQLLNKRLDRIDPEYYDYTVWDEGHHTKADTYDRVVKHFRPAFQLALTATPDRQDRRDIREHFGDPLYSKGLAEAMARGWLVDVDYHIVFDDVVKEAMASGFEPKTLKEFHELFTIRPRNEVIAKNIREERHKIGLDEAKTIVFCESIAHAEEMAELLGGVAYHSAIEKDEQTQTLNRFRQGSLPVICTVDMFNEGMDVPDARLLVFLRSTQSATIFEQQLGRGLRQAPGKDRVSVLDFVANVERITRIRELSARISKARAHQAKQEGEQEDLSDIAIIDDETTGLLLHNEHSDFDFDRLAVNVLEKLNRLEAIAPQEWLSLHAIAARSPFSEPTVASVARKLQLEGQVMRNAHGHNVTFYSPAQQQLIETELAKRQLPAGWLTPHSVAKNQETHARVVERVAGELGVAGIRRINARGKEATFYSPTEVALITQNLPSRVAVAEAPEGYHKMADLESLTGLSEMTITKHVADLGMEWSQYKGEAGQAVRFLNPTQVEMLRSHLGATHSKAVAPEGFFSLRGSARELGISESSIKSLCSSLGIEPGEYADPQSRAAGKYLSPMQIEQLRSSEFFTTPLASGGYAHGKAVAESLGVSRARIRNIATVLGIQPTRLKDPRTKKILDHYSPDQVQQMRDFGDSYAEAPGDSAPRRKRE